jgi:hypothetical protein
MIAPAKTRTLQSDDPVSAEIERYLLARGDWVSADEICRTFGVRERRLRQMDDLPGLCTAFAISLSKSGFKHVALATEAEWVHAKNAARRDAVAKFRRVQVWSERRRNTAKVLRAGLFEKDSGQGLMPGVLV